MYSGCGVQTGGTDRQVVVSGTHPLLVETCDMSDGWWCCIWREVGVVSLVLTPYDHIPTPRGTLLTPSLYLTHPPPPSCPDACRYGRAPSGRPMCMCPSILEATPEGWRTPREGGVSLGVPHISSYGGLAII